MMKSSPTPQALYAQAQQALQLGDRQRAITLYLQAIAIAPAFADAHHMLGIVHYQQGALNEAARYIGNAVHIAPKHLPYLNNYALMLNALNQPDQALRYLQQAIGLAPKDLDIQVNLANTLLSLKRYEEAAGYYRRLVRLQSQRDDLRAALGHCLSQIGNQAHQHGHYKLAEAAFSEAIRYQQHEAAYHYNLANALRELGQTKAALDHYQEALSLNPHDADTHNNLGNVQRELGQLDVAVQSYQSALKLDPNLHHARVHLVHQKQHICDWHGLNEDIETIRSWVSTLPTAQISPFAFLAMPGTTPSEQLQCASNWVNQRYQPYLTGDHPAVKPTKARVTTKSKIKIGYLSADFRLHPLAFLITDVIACHDKSQFEVIGLSYGVNDNSVERQTLIKQFTAFYDIKDLSEVDCAKKIQALGIDILVDLTGYTHSSRTGIVALKAATIHINWLGFPGTMGYYRTPENTNAPLFDYLITDEVITPPEHHAHYAERLLYLPCYQANNRQRPIARVLSRAECGLPMDAFVFCAFNQTFKITETVFQIWMQLLRSVPKSVLWLLESNRWAKKNLIQQAQACGIAPERLIFAPRVAIDVHLARHEHADLFLDTQPYNAHTTCSDALWMGVPVITCMGDTFASRVAASLIRAAGLTADHEARLICDHLTDYFDQALYLSQHPAELAAIKTSLRNARASSGLFDPQALTTLLERHYQTIWSTIQNAVSG